MLYELEQAIRDAIEYHLLGTQMVLADAQQGDTTLLVGSTASLSPGDQIALYDGDCDDTKLEILTVCEVFNEQAIRVNPPLAGNWECSVLDGSAISLQSVVQKLYDGEFIQYVTQGNPPSIPRYPAITVECTGNDNEALTLGVGVFSQEFGVRVTVWAEKETYHDARKQVQRLASKIELALFRTVFPVVCPWVEALLAEDMNPEQSFFVVTDGSELVQNYPYPIYLSTFDGRYPTQIIEQMGANAFYIDRVYPRWFYEGLTTIVRPRVHIYDSFCDGVTIDEGPDNLIYADISYRAKAARIRYSEPFTG